jgi:prepilin-type N-terminal cleavage/methylation domain-containing protein
VRARPPRRARTRWPEVRQVTGGGREGGFTLVELLVVVAVVPLVVGAIGAGLVAVFTIQGKVSNRLTDSEDAQITSSIFVQDVQQSLQLTIDHAASQCGPGTQLLGLEWGLNAATSTYQTVVSYNLVHSGSTVLLRRMYCANGVSATPSSSRTLSFDADPNQPSPLLSPAAVETEAGQDWVPSSGVAEVKFSVTEPSSKYTYSLTAVPADSSPPSTAGSPIIVASNTTCGFAATQGGTVSNGTYAKTLCFVDFSGYNATSAAAPSCQEFVAAIPGGDTLSFCMSESGNQPMFASGLPTYPEAFLGNTLKNADGSYAPFYTALGCPDNTPAETGSGAATPSCIKPAMYQTNTGFGPTNTITVTNISVTTATGAPATGWEFVSADAETTDSNEQITWTANTALQLLPNNPGTPAQYAANPQLMYGDTCNNTPNWNGPQGSGTDQIVCQSGLNEPSSTKTGTPMVEALTPTAMTVGMKGAGLEGVAVGLLLS